MLHTMTFWQSAVYGGLASSGAALLAAGETQALALDFTDMSALVRDTGTPANNFEGDPNDLVDYTAPSAKWIRLQSGLWARDTTLRTEYDESGDPLGLLVEEARTSLAIRGRELGNATYWTASNITTSAVQGVDGVLAAATRITATANNGTVLGSTNTSASAARRLAPFVRRVTGVGNLEWTLDGGSTWTALSGITSSWKRIGVGATVANPQVGFRIVSSGDEFDIDFSNGETGAFDTSPLHVNGATGLVTRAADNISLSASNFAYSFAAGTAFAAFSRLTITSRGDAFGGSDNGASPMWTMFMPNDEVSLFTRDNVGNADNIVAVSGITAGQIVKFAGAYQDANSAASANGGAAVTGSSSGARSGTNGLVYIGSNDTGAVPLNGHVKQVMYLPRRASNSELVALTT